MKLAHQRVLVALSVALLTAKGAYPDYIISNVDWCLPVTFQDVLRIPATDSVDVSRILIHYRFCYPFNSPASCAGDSDSECYPTSEQNLGNVFVQFDVFKWRHECPNMKDISNLTNPSSTDIKNCVDYLNSYTGAPADKVRVVYDMSLITRDNLIITAFPGPPKYDEGLLSLVVPHPSGMCITTEIQSNSLTLPFIEGIDVDQCREGKNDPIVGLYMSGDNISHISVSGITVWPHEDVLSDTIQIIGAMVGTLYEEVDVTISKVWNVSMTSYPSTSNPSNELFQLSAFLQDVDMPTAFIVNTDINSNPVAVAAISAHPGPWPTNYMNFTLLRRDTVVYSATSHTTRAGLSVMIYLGIGAAAGVVLVGICAVLWHSLHHGHDDDVKRIVKKSK